MRIDLVLVTEVLAARTGYALIDRNARKGDKPSDHTPVFIDVSEGRRVQAVNATTSEV
jgi:exodeoxyribonuclease-3